MNLSDEQHDLLTPREKEVLTLVAEGKSNKEVAQALFISPLTVETHRSHFMQKLDLHSVAEIVQYGFRRGMVS